MNNPIAKKEAMELISKVNKNTKIRKREKNLAFMKKYNITDNMAKEYVESLKENHFVNKVINKDKKLDTDYLYEFYATGTFYDYYGNEDIVPIYIKICKLKTNQIICIVSFHDREL